MRAVINIQEGDKQYDSMVKRAKEGVQRSDNVFIVARGEDNRKAKIEPLVVMRDIAFYAAHKIEDGLVFRNDMPDEIIKAAVGNTIDGARICSLSAVVSFFPNCPFHKVEDWHPVFREEPLFVLTNESRMEGAGILFCNDVLHKIWEKIGNYYIIPSSIHELLIFADNNSLDREDISQMIVSVNQSIVSEEERLSNNPFYYDGELKGGA